MSSITTVVTPEPPQQPFDIDHHLNVFIPRPRLYLLPKPLSHFLGYRSPSYSSQPSFSTLLTALWAALGAFVGLAVTSLVFRALPTLTTAVANPIIIGSFGATAILEYNTVTSPLAQPRNALLGQFLSALIGIIVAKLFMLLPTDDKFDGLLCISGPLAVAISSAVMTLTKTVHPPGGATALLAVTSAPIRDLGWELLLLVILGSVLILIVACLLNNVQRRFPLYWWTEHDLSSRKTADGDEDIAEGVVGLEHLEDSGVPEKQERKGHEIVVTNNEVLVPDMLALSNEEMAFLHMLRSRLLRCRVEEEPDSS